MAIAQNQINEGIKNRFSKPRQIALHHPVEVGQHLMTKAGRLYIVREVVEGQHVLFEWGDLLLIDEEKIYGNVSFDWTEEMRVILPQRGREAGGLKRWKQQKNTNPPSWLFRMRTGSSVGVRQKRP